MRSILAATFVATLGLAEISGAQGYPPSQRAALTQNVALTKIEVSYGRPVARGRALFGHLVPWDSVWNPGADSASRISFDHDVTIEGNALKAGTYSVWLVARERASWTVIFSNAGHTFHRPYPGASSDALRVDVAPEIMSHVESLTIGFPSVVRDEATLRIQWGTTAVSLRLKAGWRPAS